MKRVRERARVTQARLANLAGTSQPAIAAYEAGRRTPTLSTLERLARAVGLELAVEFVPPSTREDRRSLFLHDAVARRLEEQPRAVISRAKENLALMRRKHPHAGRLLDEWEALLESHPTRLADALRDPRPHARELRQASPFGGIFSAPERAALYREFRAAEVERGPPRSGAGS
ncbi:MAG: helix-turn-helix transcriptional regulator [Gemmatimonadota bacterium]|nr:helix-turn-helix transcriptional regulator [Gemmatimonadota bacterium]